MVGADESTELWQPPKVANYFLNNLNKKTLMEKAPVILDEFYSWTIIKNIWAIPCLFFFIFVFSMQLTVNK